MKISDSRGSQLNNDTCVSNVGDNRYNLVLIASARAREIKRQHKESDKREHVFSTVTALLEVQEGKIGKEYLNKVR
jgi:DNA-directed RNA polymerase omega subunit